MLDRKTVGGEKFLHCIRLTRAFCDDSQEIFLKIFRYYSFV